MSDDENGIESYLRKGAVVGLHLDPVQNPGPRSRILVRIRDWETGSHIILDRPKSGGRYAPLRREQPCIIRFVASSNTCSFETTVSSWEEEGQNASCWIEWPGNVNIIPFRKYYRLKVTLPCKFSLEGGICYGEIRDLSMGGCGICVQQEVPVNTVFRLAFTLPDGLTLENVGAVVRAARQIGKDYFLGCEFADRQEHVQSDIAFSVSVAYERERSDAKNAKPHVLIIDGQENNTAALRNDFNLRGWDVLTAAGTIDGLQRLRAAKPAALVISQDQRELTGLDIVRLVKLTRGFERLPIFLYGDDDEALKEKAARTGVKTFFALPLNSAAICEAVVADANSEVRS